MVAFLNHFTFLNHLNQVLFLYPLKIPENQRIYDVSRDFRNGVLAQNLLIIQIQSTNSANELKGAKILGEEVYKSPLENV